MRASPLARRRAAERGLALEDIAGSGRDGAVVAADVDLLELDQFHQHAPAFGGDIEDPADRLVEGLGLAGRSEPASGSVEAEG